MLNSTKPQYIYGVHENLNGAINSYLLFKKLKNKSDQKHKNIKLALRHLKSSIEEKINLSKENFKIKDTDQIIKIFSEYQTLRGIKKSTLSPQKSHIRDFWQYFVLFREKSDLPSYFEARLEYFLQKYGTVAKNFFEDCFGKDFNLKNLLNWTQEKNSSNKSDKKRKNEYFLDIVMQIEEKLELEKGILTESLPTSCFKDFNARNLTLFSEKVRNISRRQYKITTSHTDKEIADFLEYKKAAIPPRGLLRAKGARYSSTNGADTPTGNMAAGMISNFFGFCSLPNNCKDLDARGLGLPQEHLTLGLLTNINYVTEFISCFSRSRSGGKYNSGHVTFLNLTASLLREKYGYLYQQPEFAKKIGLKMTESEWQEYCLSVRKSILAFVNAIGEERKTGGSEFEISRDPSEPILTILRDPNPLGIVTSSLQKMQEDIKKFPPGSLQQAILYRDFLLFSLLQANPLRIRMFSIMEFDRHLFKKSDGSWWLTFKKNEFKNRSSLSSDYEMRLNPAIWPIIENYQKNYRPLFPNSEKSKYVFLPAKAKKSKKSKKPGSNIGIKSFYYIISRRTYTYFPGNYSFGPHSFRHIIATGIIKKYPGNGFYLAAKMLHDKLKTLEQTYAHLKTSDEIEPYNDLLTSLYETAGFSETLYDVENNEDEIDEA